MARFQRLALQPPARAARFRLGFVAIGDALDVSALWMARPSQDSASRLVAVELAQPLVADAEMVRDLVQHDAAYLGLQPLGIAAAPRSSGPR